MEEGRLSNLHQQRGSPVVRKLLMGLVAAIATAALTYSHQLGGEGISPENLQTVIGLTANRQKMKTTSTVYDASGLPSLLVLGAQKAGSTATSKYIFDYTGGRACGAEKNRKEPHFFSTGKWDKGTDFYREMFRHCSRNETVELVLDATPRNLVMAERVYEIYSKANAVDKLKVMVTLREPVARELSWYHQLYRKQEEIRQRPGRRKPLSGMVVNNTSHEIMSFDEWIDNHVLRQIEQGKNMGVYVRFLKQWFDLFPRENILVQSYDELKNDPESFLQRMHSFLELPSDGPLLLPEANSAHAATEKPTPCSVQERLSAHYTLFNEELYELLEANPGPSVEVRPFPRFQFQCKK